jgi:hypothetical protein
MLIDDLEQDVADRTDVVVFDVSNSAAAPRKPRKKK